MKKLIGYVVAIVIFAGIGLGVKHFVDGPSQSVNGILVIGADQDVNKVKELYQDRSKEMSDYKIKMVTTKIGSNDARSINYSVITRSTAEQFIKKGMIRARQDSGSASIISEPVIHIKELSTGRNLFFSSSDADMKNNQIDLKGQMVSVQYVNRQAWIGYRPMDLVIVNDQTYNNIKEAESTISLIHFQNDSFDYKNKEKVNKVVDEIRSVSTVSEEKVNFVDVQD